MNYRAYLIQMAQRGKIIKTGGTLQVMSHSSIKRGENILGPWVRKYLASSKTDTYSGGTIRKLILDRLDNGIEPLTT